MANRGQGFVVRWARRLAVFVCVLATALAAIVALAIGLLQVPTVRRQAVAIAMDRVNLLFLGTIRVGRVEGFLPWHVSIADVEVIDLDGRAIAGAARVTGDLEPLALLRQTVRFERLRVEGAWASVQDERGDVVLARAFRPIGPGSAQPASGAAGPSAWVVEAGRASVEGEVALGPGLAGRLGAIELDGAVRYAGGVLSWRDLVLVVRPGERAPATGPIRVRSAGRLAPGRIELDRFELDARPGTLVAHGSVRDFADPLLGVTIERAQADLDALREVGLLPGLPVRGCAIVTGTVAGRLAGLRVALDVDSDGGRLEIDGTAGLVPGIGPRYDLAIRGTGLAPWQVLTSPGPVPPALGADLVARLRGEGNPLGVGTAEALVSLDRIVGIPAAPEAVVVRARVLDGWISAEVGVDGPDGQSVVADVSVPGLAAGRLFAHARVRDADAGGLLEAFGVPGYAGRVSRLDAQASIGNGTISNSWEIEGRVRLAASGLGRSAGADPAASVGSVALTADASWTGTGLPAGVVHADLRDVRAGPGGAGRVRVDAVLSSSGSRPHVAGSLLVQDVTWPGDATTGSVAGTFETTLDARGPVEGRVRVATDGVGLGAGRGVGRTSLEATIERIAGASGAYTGRVTVGAADARISGIRIGSVKADAAATLRLGRGLPSVALDLALRDVELPWRTIDSLALRATLPARGPLTVRLTAAARNLRLALDAEGGLPADGRSPWFRVRHLEVLDGTYGLTTTGDGGIRLDPDGAWVAEGLRLGGPLAGRDEVLASGRLDPVTGAVEARIEARAIDLAALPERVLRLSGIVLDPGALPGGIADLDATVGGTLEAPVVEAAVTLRDGSYAAVRGLAVTAHATLGGPVAHLDAEAAWAHGSLLDVAFDAPVSIGWERTDDGQALRLRLDRGAPVRLSATLAGVDLAGLREYLGPAFRGLEGRVTGELALDGSLADPRGRLKMRLADARLGALRNVAADVDAVLSAGRTIVHASVDQADQSLVLDAEAPINLVAAVASPSPMAGLRRALSERPFRVALEVANVRPGRLPVLSYAANGMLGPTVVSGAVEVAGTLPALVATGFLDAKAILIGYLETDVRLAFVQQGKDLAIRIDVASDDAPFGSATALFPGGLSAMLAGRDLRSLLADPAARLGVSTVRVPVPTVARLLPEAGRNLSTLVPEGELTLTAEVAGGPGGASGRANLLVEAAPDAPASVRGLARSIRLEVDLGPDRTIVTAEVLQESEGGGLRLDAEAGTGSRALASGVLAPFPIRASLEAEGFDLQELSTVFPSVFGPTRGRLIADIRLTGTSEAPRVDGTLEARFDDLRLSRAGLRQRDLVLALDIAGGKLHLRPVHLVAGGTLDLSLDVDVGALRASAISLAGRLEARHFQAMASEETSLKVTVDLALGGTLARPSVRGDATVEAAESTASLSVRAVTAPGLPADVSFEAGAGESLAPVPGPRAQSGFPADIDVKLAIPARAVHLRNELVDVFVTGDLHVRTVRDAIALTGVISVDEGQVVLYGRKFDLNEDSRVVFGGSPGINPTLDVTADYPIRDVDLSALGLAADRDSRVIVEVTGTAEHPRLRLSSQPPMDDTNIVSIVTIGSPVGASQAKQNTLETQTTNLVVGLATGTVSKMLQGELPIDVFEYSPSAETAAAAQVTVGKRVMRNLMVLYRANIGFASRDENTNEVEVQYDITRRIQLRTRYGDAGQGSIDLLLRWRY